jgi:Domain of unknown function (DUF4395)
MGNIIGFPNAVNEKAARTVAAGVAVLGVTTLVLSFTAGHVWLWLDALIAAGFLARVFAGPRLSPLGQFATRIVAPRLGAPKLVPGPPKRFAQGIGATVTIAGVLFLAAGHAAACQALLGILIVAACLESILGFCVGCRIFASLMRFGLIPERMCASCADITLRQA